MRAAIAKGTPKGIIQAPPSKSFSHRELIAGMLSDSSVISSIAFSDDINATLRCMEALGSSFKAIGDSVTFLGLEKAQKIPVLDCGESGSTMRFMLPIALCFYDEVVIKGSKRLLSRGVDAYKSCLHEHSIKIVEGEDHIEAYGKMTPGVFNIDASSSSQYVSGLLFALSILDGDSRIEFIGKPSSTHYIEMTIETMGKFGVYVHKTPNGYLVPGNQRYKDMASTVEGDYSNAAFLEAFSYLGGDVTLYGLKEDSSQGDKIYRELFKKLDQGFQTIDLDESIDLAPVCFAFASLRHGGRFTGIKRLRIKESNRAEAMMEELKKVGCEVILEEDCLTVHPSTSIPDKALFDSHNDHRIVMALSLYSTVMDVFVDGYECVNKSFPNFFEVLGELGMEVCLNV